MESFLKFLQSNRAVLLAAIMSLMTQLWHSVRAFVMLDVGGTENVWNYLFGILFSVSTSFAILLFTVRGRTRWAMFFLIVEVFINVIHYSVMDMPMGPILFSTLFMCIIVPVTISVYSAEIDVDEKDEKWNNGALDNLDFMDKPEMSQAILDKMPEHSFNWLVKDKSEKLDDNQFIEEVNNIIGFDITNPNDKSGKVPEATKSELRKLWKQRKDKDAEAIKAEMKSILNKNGRPLFK